MDDILPELVEDFERVSKEIGSELYRGKNTVGIYDVLKAHYLIVDKFAREGEGIGGVGPRDVNLLHSTLSRQVTGFSGRQKWQGDLDICATLFFGLVKNHAFYDGNKRTALLTLLFHLWKLGRVPTIKQKRLEQLALRTAMNQLALYNSYARFQKFKDRDVMFLSHFLHKNTRKQDRRTYMITYRQLDIILRKFNFKLANPSKNFIDVVREEEVLTWRKFRLERTLKETRVAHIPFPGMNKQVCTRDIKYVRKATGLTAKNGIDSAVFFKDADPLNVLVHQYGGVLRRLADK